jgi:hypothetical protein
MPRAFWNGLGWGLITMDAILTFTMTKNPMAASHPDAQRRAILAGILLSLVGCLAFAYGRFVPAGTKRGWSGGFLLSFFVAAPMLFAALFYCAARLIG